MTKHPNKPAILAACLALASCASAPPLDPQEQERAHAAMEAFEDFARAGEWYGLYFQGHKVGYMARERSVTKDYLQISTKTQSHSQGLGRATTSVNVITERFERVPPYHALLIEERDGADEFASMARIRKTADGYVGEHRESGSRIDRPLFDFQYMLADALAPELWMRANAQKDACLSYPTYNLSDLQREWATECIGRVYTRTVDGTEVEVADMLYGEAGGLLRMVRARSGEMMLTQYGADFEVRLEPRDIATDLEAPFDFFLDNMVRVDQPLGEASLIKRLTVDLVGLEGLAPGAAPGQMVQVRRPEGVVRLTVDTHARQDSNLNPAELAQGLELTESHRLNYDRLVELADVAVAGARTDAQRVRNLAAFVYNFIEADFSSEPISLSKLLQSQRGDCTEYSQLLDALLRVANIPTREVLGLVYAGDEAQTFAHHAWNEVFVDGQWTPVDASWNEFPVNATHVRYPLDRGYAVGVMQSMAGVELKVVDIEYAIP